MKQAIPGFVLLALLVSSCFSPKGASISTPTNNVSQVATAAEPTATATAIPPTPTLDIESMSVEKAAEAYLNGEVAYPAEWSDEQKHDLAKSVAEYLNENNINEAFVPLSIDGVGHIQVGWDENAEKWRSSHNAAESIDLTGSKLPELFVAGYTNSEGLDVIIDENGKEIIVPKIDLPGSLGEMSMSELYSMDQEQLKNYIVDLMINANNLGDSKNFIEQKRDDHFVLPVVLEDGNRNHSEIYSIIFRGATGDNVSIPEANIHFLNQPTNSVLMPILDKATGKILAWARIQQGMPELGRVRGFTFSSTESNLNMYICSVDSPQLYGNNTPNYSPGVFFVGNTTESTYAGTGGDPFLEKGMGIGSEADLLEILAASDLTKVVKKLETLRLVVLFPNVLIYEQ